MSSLQYFAQLKAGKSEWVAVEFDQLAPYIEAHRPELITTTATNAKTKGSGDESIYRAEFVAFDIDNPDISESIAATRRLVSKLIADGASPEQFQIFASGKKGFHVLVPMGLLTLKSQAETWLVTATKLFAEARFVDGMDMRIYSQGKGRMLRQANVERSIGTFKVQLSLEELETLNPESYANLVSQPRPLIAPIAIGLVDALALQWSKACDEAKALHESRKQKAAKRVKDLARRESMPESLVRTRLQDAVMYLARKQGSDYADYGSWFGMLAALHQIDEYELALEFSKAVPNWGGHRAFDDQWNKFSDTGDDLLTEASIFFKAKEAGWGDEASKSKATEEVKSWLERIKSDKGLAGDDGFIAWLRFLQRQDRAEFIRTMDSPVLKGVKRMVSAALGETDGKDQPSHLDIALEALEELGGKENLLFSGGSFYRYSGKAWQAVEEIQTVQAAVHKAFGGRNFTASSVHSVVELLKTEAHRPNVTFDQRSATVIAFENGELHLTGGGHWSLKPHEAEHYLTSLVPWTYDPNATAERFMKWCREVFRDDDDQADKIKLLLEYIGYSLTASTHFQKFVVLFGTTSNNGKSTLLDLMGCILGVQNVAHIKISDLGERFKGALLRGKLANLCAEISAGERIPDGVLKSIVSGDSLTAEFKGRDGFNFKPYAKLWFGANHKPSTRDFSPAIIEKRAEFLTFNRRFEAGKDEDAAIVDKLIPEIPGVIRISLEAYAKAVQRGYLAAPPSSKAIKAEWKAETDTVGEWFEDCCYLEPGGVVAVSRALDEFKGWGASLGYSVRDYSSKALTNRLKPLGITCARVYIDGVQNRAYVGMAIEHSSTTSR